MRYWNKKITTDVSDVVKPTKGVRTTSPIRGSRRPFSSTIPSQELEEDRPTLTTMAFPETDPTDKAKGGVDERVPASTGTHFPRYTITNAETDRTYNTTATSTTELGKVLSTVITDLHNAFSSINRRLRDGGL